jgi:HEAT repeat protein
MGGLDANETALNDLMDALADSTADDEQREEAASAIAEMSHHALPGLRHMLQTGDPDIRMWAVRALTVSGSPSSRSLLRETLADSDPDVRACAALGLGELAAAEASNPLVRLMADESVFVARIASNALIQIGQPAIPVLIEALSDKSPAVRAGAARALVPLESHDAIPALFAALDDASAIVTYYAEEALERMGVGMIFLKP